MVALEEYMKKLNEEIKQAKKEAPQLELEKMIVSLFDNLESPDIEGIIHDINSRMKVFNTNYPYLQRLRTAFMKAFREKSDQMAGKGSYRTNVKKVLSNFQKIAEKLDIARWMDESSRDAKDQCLRDAATLAEWPYSLKAKFNEQSRFLLEAVRAADLNRMKDALSLGANIDYVDPESGETPLTLAVLSGRADMVSFLIENLADINKENKHQELAIFLAAKNGFFEAMILLLNVGAWVNWDKFKAALSLEDFRQLCAASVRSSSVVIDPIAPVIGVVDESELHTKEEALFTAVDDGDVEAVERLILDGANLNYQGPFHTPLTSAASKNKEAVVEKLLDLGANLDWGALSQTKTMKACVVRVLNKMIFQDIDDLFQFKYEPNNHLALINQKTAHFVSSEFKDERANVRKYFVKKMNEKRKELASVIDVIILKAARDRFSLIEQTMAIIQSPDGEKEKSSMEQLRQWINRLNERIAKLEGEEKTKYQPGLTQFASVEPADFNNRPELGRDAGFTL
jgi:ankyrin repeat protein